MGYMGDGKKQKKKKKWKQVKKNNGVRRADRAIDTADKRETARILSPQCLHGLLVFVLHL